jgi:sec-independent protein translocase protein TatA
MTEPVGFTKNQGLLKGYGGYVIMLGPWELILILLIALMLFGGKRIPEIMGGLGKGIRLFKRSMEIDDALPPQPPRAGHQEHPKENAEQK